MNLTYIKDLSFIPVACLIAVLAVSTLAGDAHIDESSPGCDGSTHSCSRGAPCDYSTSLLQTTSHLHRQKGQDDGDDDDEAIVVGAIKALASEVNDLKKSVSAIKRSSDIAVSAKSGQSTPTVLSDKCPCQKPMLLNSQPEWNISASLPRGIKLQHAGWTADSMNRGMGVFADRDFRRGELVGSAMAQAVECKSQTVNTPLGDWVIGCPTHFYALPDCSGIPQDGDSAKVGLFASWMSFLNGNGVNTPSLLDVGTDNTAKLSGIEESVQVERIQDLQSRHAKDDDASNVESRRITPEVLVDNVAFAPNSCHPNAKDTLFHLVATTDIHKGDEMLLQYDWRPSSMLSGEAHSSDKSTFPGLGKLARMAKKAAKKAAPVAAGAVAAGALGAAAGAGASARLFHGIGGAFGPFGPPAPMPMPMPMPPWDVPPLGTWPNIPDPGLDSGDLSSLGGGAAGHHLRAAAGHAAHAVKHLLR